MNYKVWYRRVLELYSDLDFQTKVFVCGRLFIAPFLQIAKHVPSDGTILDIGCGYGIFSNLLAITEPSRTVIGIDITKERIDKAQKTVSNRKNVEFITGDINQRYISQKVYDAIVGVDLLHHIPYKEQKELIRWSYDRLNKNGTLILKEVDVKPRWKLAFSYIHDVVINHAYGKLFFLGSDSLETVLSETGFRIHNKMAFRFSPYAHVLYVCKK